MKEEIKKNIVVIIISLGSMALTVIGTLGGVWLTNQHNSKMQIQQLKIDKTNKKIYLIESIHASFSQRQALFDKIVANIEEDLESAKISSFKEGKGKYGGEKKALIYKVRILLNEYMNEFTSFNNYIDNINHQLAMNFPNKSYNKLLKEVLDTEMKVYMALFNFETLDITINTKSNVMSTHSKFLRNLLKTRKELDNINF